MVYAAVSEFTGYLSFLNPPETPCLECFVGAVRPPVDPPVPGATAGAVGTLEAMEAIKFLTGIGATLAGRLLVMEGAVPGFDVIDVDRDPTCAACSVFACQYWVEPLNKPLEARHPRLEIPMARVTVEDCVDKVPNRFELVMLAAHRARGHHRPRRLLNGDPG